MAFPTSPTDGQVTVQNGIRYTYASATNSWTRSAASVSTLSILSDQFVGDGSTISFTLSSTPVSSDVVSAIVDGVPQLRGAFTLSGNVVTFTGTPANGALIEIRTMQVAGLGVLTGLVFNSFTGDGTTTAYTLSTQPTNKNYTLVTIGGVTQEKSRYSVSGTTLTFTVAAPPVGEPIEVMTFGPAITTSGSGGGTGYNISNGTSSVSVATNSNITASVSGTTILNLSTSGANIAGYANITGNITGANANLGNLVVANYFSGNGSSLTGVTSSTVTSSAQPNITSVGTLTSLSVGGNIASLNANLGNLVTANYFSGNGSLLTGITVSSGTSIVNGTSNVAVVSSGGNVTIGVAGTSNVVVVSSGQANITGLLGVTGNISGNYFIGNGSQLTGITAGTSASKAIALNILFGG